MTLKTNNYLVVMAMETVAGTSVSPLTGTSSATLTATGEVIPVTEMAIPELGGEELISEVVQNGFQNTPGEGLTAKMMTFTLNCEMAPDGDEWPTVDLPTGITGTVYTDESPAAILAPRPYFHNLMAIAGIVAKTGTDDGPTGSGDVNGIQVVYGPDSDQALNGATATIGVWVDGIYYEAKGCRADVTITREVGKKDMIAFAISGAFSRIVDTYTGLDDATVNPTYTPSIGRSANFTFGGVAASAICASAWEFSLQSEVTQRKCLNAEDGIGSYDLTDRDPQITATIEAIPLGTYDVYADLIAGTTSEMNMEFDTGAANKKAFGFDAAAVQPTSVPHSDENGIFTHSGLTFRVVSTTKDGDYTLEVTSPDFYETSS